MAEKRKKFATKNELVKRYLVVWSVFMIFLIIALHFFLLKGNIFLEIFISMNLGTFILFGLDKVWAAQENSPRIPERFFYVAAFLGGALAIMIGASFFRHKRRKFSFMWKIVVAFFLQLGFLIYVLNESFGSF